MSRQSLGLVHDNALINASLWTLFRFEIHCEVLRTINFKTCFTINHSRGFLNSALRTTSENSPSGSVCSCARITTRKLMSRGNEKCFHKKLFGQRNRVWCENSFKCFAFTPSAIRNYMKGLKFIVNLNWVMKSKVKMKHAIENRQWTFFYEIFLRTSHEIWFIVQDWFLTIQNELLVSTQKAIKTRTNPINTTKSHLTSTLPKMLCNSKLITFWWRSLFVASPNPSVKSSKKSKIS